VVSAAIAVLELLFRSPLHFQHPGLILYPLVLWVAFVEGVWAGIAGALLSTAYVAFRVLHLGGPLRPPTEPWLFVLLASSVIVGAGVVGVVRVRLESRLALERSARAAAEADRERAAALLESITDGFVALDREWRLTFINAAAERLVGCDRQEVLGQDIRQLLGWTEDDVFYSHYRRALHDNVPVHFEAASRLVDAWFEVHAYPSPTGLTIFFHDGSERREREERLRSLSLLDELTGVYNRRGFFTLAEQQCKLAVRKRRSMVLFFVDFDDLKQINDTHGHGAGDQALVALGNALRQTFRESDIVGRIGGDEFAALAVESDDTSVPMLLDRLYASLQGTSAQAGIPAVLSVSTGTAAFDPTAPCSVHDLLATADERMYHRKRQRRG
jgi:diguanylate cyclase (GGDEF)-like protein/PAS domain S-box-containing protein